MQLMAFFELLQCVQTHESLMHRFLPADAAEIGEAASQVAAALRQAMSAQFRSRAAEFSRQLQQEVCSRRWRCADIS